MHQNAIRNEVLRVLRAQGIDVGTKAIALIIEMKDKNHTVEEILAAVKKMKGIA